MLRITVIDFSEESLTNVKLEGRVAGSAVAELRRLCEDLLVRGERGRISLDLANVSFIDNVGIDLLRTLVCRRVEVSNCSSFVTELLKGILPCS